MLLVSFLAILSLLPAGYQAKIIEGELVTNKDWVFLTRFCFLSKDGIFEYNVSYPREYAAQSLYLYFDARSQWPAVYKQNKTCREKTSVLIDDFNQVINLTEYNRNYRATTASGCKLDPRPDENNQTWYRCVHHRTFQSYRERWWFIAVGNCDAKKGLKLKYSISMINSFNEGWLKHFSADQFYILHTDVVMCIFFNLLFLASCFEAKALYARHLFHHTYKLYIGSLFAECLGLICLSVYYGFYARDGWAPVGWRLAGKGFEAASTLTFTLLLLLISKGYTITRAKLKKRTVFKFSMFMVMSTIGYVIIFYHEQFLFDPGEVLYIYESFFGYLLISLRLLAWSWFSYAIVFTLIHYPQKSAFFAKLYLVYSIWFISAPIVIMVATFVIPRWMREKVINGVELAIVFKAHLIFFFLTRPSRANKNFPFHVRTTQIAIMEKINGGLGESGSLEHFTNYKYAPSRAMPPAVSIFSIANSANGQLYSLGGGMARAMTSNGVPIAIAGMNGHMIATSVEDHVSTPTPPGEQQRQLGSSSGRLLTSRGNASVNGTSIESEITSMTSLSNYSSNNTSRATPPEAMPQAEE